MSTFLQLKNHYKLNSPHYKMIAVVYHKAIFLAICCSRIFSRSINIINILAMKKPKTKVLHERGDLNCNFHLLV